MKTICVEEIIWPFKEGIPLYPSVASKDKVSYAIELMLKNNLKSIVVMRKNRPIGMLYLQDALKKLGLYV